MLCRYLAAILAVCSLQAYAGSAHYSQQHHSKEDLQSFSYDKDSSGAPGRIGDMRLDEMRTAALTAGAQNGYIERLNEIKSNITSIEDRLDQIYDFKALMSLSTDGVEELHVLPPVIAKTEDLVRLSGDATRLVKSKTEYVIVRPAMLTTIAPNWRQYLLFDGKVSASRPPNALLPRNNSEQRRWSEWVESGWQSGRAQAEREMSYRSRRLGADFLGMTTYMTLAEEGKVKKPVVSTSFEGVTSSSDRLTLETTTIHLAMPSQFNGDKESWRAFVLDPRGSLRLPIELKEGGR